MPANEDQAPASEGRAPASEGRALHLAHWNCHVGRDPDEVAAQVRGILTSGPELDALALLECRGATLAAVRTALSRLPSSQPRYSVHAPLFYEYQDAALVVRRGPGSHYPSYPALHSGVETIKVPWTGPDGKEWRGKAIPWAILPDPDPEPSGEGDVLVMAIHNVWAPHLNEDAWAAVRQYVEHRANSFAGGRLALIGDWNLSTNRLGVLARDVGGHGLMGSPPDGGIFRGLRVDVKTGKKRGSDHPVTRYTAHPAKS